MMEENRKYYFVGTKFGEYDNLEHYKEEGKWELGWYNDEENAQYQKMLKVFNKIKSGDILLAKTSYTKKNNLPFEKKNDMTVSVMKIRGMAIVKEVLDDKHTVIVDWKENYSEREWYFFTGQETIWVPSNIKNREKETSQLIDFATSEKIKEQNYDYFLNHPYWNKYKKIETEENLKLQNYKDILKTSKNLILRGAPGTGKTYLAKQIAEELTDGNEDQIGFVQFHPSYDYTDFVEGLRPSSGDDGQIGFKLQDGIFREFCKKAKKATESGGQDNFDEAWDKFFEAVNDVDLDGSYDIKTLTGKPMHLIAYMRNEMSGVMEKGSASLFYNKAQCYNIYKGDSGVPKGGLDNYRKAVVKHLKEKYGLVNYVKPTETTTDKKFVFIIDEINRGEISKIFGELFFSIDPDYRGEKGAVSTQYANLHETDEKFYIPENVYIIGTMNDIDRSVDTFDFAMRHRFRFVEIKAADTMGMWENNDEFDNDKIEEARIRLTNLNKAISNTEGLNSHYHIGPSYFLKLKDLDYDYDILWSDYLEPLLKDYLRGSYDETDSLDKLKDAYNNEEETDETH
ncbi:AAA family ATPase [Streptococcus mutans]|uniref:McrB family protein n=1 Tax=Streptococcus mutans TaxID=1309 RepID=UPI000516EA67